MITNFLPMNYDGFKHCWSIKHISLRLSCFYVPAVLKSIIIHAQSFVIPIIYHGNGSPDWSISVHQFRIREYYWSLLITNSLAYTYSEIRGGCLNASSFPAVVQYPVCWAWLPGSWLWCWGCIVGWKCLKK